MSDPLPTSALQKAISSEACPINEFRPLPERKEGQTYQPMNWSWFELQFLYRVEIKCDMRMCQGERFCAFTHIKEAMVNDPLRWGCYRTDWFAHMSQGVNYFYFMTRDAALVFRLWVDL